MRLLVIGSVNMDLVVRVDHVPVPGENVRGERLEMIPGGKGANQAVACARLGAETTFLARVGDDPFGRRLVEELADAGVRTDAVATVTGCASGAAMILVEADGENCIVITPGANGRLGPDDVDAARGLVADADAVVLQLEIPADTVGRAIRLAREVGTPTVVDAGPPRLPIDEAVLEADVLTPNEAEAAALLGIEPGARSAEDLARALLDRGPGAVVVKAGARGAVVAEEGRVEHVPAFSVEPVDTTAAGDAFTAALAVAVVEGTDLVPAARRANAAGALAATRLGAQPSMPTVDDLEAFLAERDG
jgi:ribokinase